MKLTVQVVNPPSSHKARKKLDQETVDGQRHDLCKEHLERLGLASQPPYQEFIVSGTLHC